jgi:hypothetical protein
MTETGETGWLAAAAVAPAGVTGGGADEVEHAVRDVRERTTARAGTTPATPAAPFVTR